MCSTLSPQAHADALARVQEHLVDGDCYQVNVTRRLSTTRRADPRALFCALVRENPAPHAALIELAATNSEADDAVALVSASPERFLGIEHTAIETRPIKGTHRHAAPLGRAPRISLST